MSSNSWASRTVLAAGIAGTIACGQAIATSPEELASPEAQQGYSLGLTLGQQAHEDLGELEVPAFLAGISDGLHGREPSLAPDQIAQALTDFDDRRRLEDQAEMAALAEANRSAGDRYREQFGQDPDVVTLESGLQYKVLEPGDGEIPGPGANVTVHYRGMLVDGREFDSSYADDEPVRFPVDRVIPGWSEALTRMPGGSKWQIVIPPDLAYGERGAGGLIGPNETLVFEMELITTG